MSRYLIYGAGTIGLTLAWLLSPYNDVDVLVKKPLTEPISLAVKDLRQKARVYEKKTFQPKTVLEYKKTYDCVLVAVNRYQLHEILPVLSAKQRLAKGFIFIQNHWNLIDELKGCLPKEKIMAAFPSNIGGGRDQKGLEVILFDEAVRLGGFNKKLIQTFRNDLHQAGVKTAYDKNIFAWLKVHYLQQSITAGALLEKKDFQMLAQDRQALQRMVRALREGIDVCYRLEPATRRICITRMIRLPITFVATVLQKLFLNQNTQEMVRNHMKQGLSEWIYGYQEVLADGLKAGIKMTYWKSYQTGVENYLRNERRN